MQLQARELAHVLNVWKVARLASVAPDGKPQLVPIVFVVDDGLIHSPVDGKPKRSAQLQRLRNVAMNPSVSLLIDQYAEDWRQLWWLRIDAVAEVVTGASIGTAALARIEAKLRSKYPQYATVPPFHDEPTLLRMKITRHVAWSSQKMDWLALREPQP